MDSVPSSTTGATHEERLEEQERLHNEFLAMLAHEVREPMTSCIGFAEMLLQKGELMSESERREALHTISRTGRRLVQLLEDILEVSRIDAGGLTFVLRPVDLRDVVGGVLDEQRFLLEGHDVRFEATGDAMAQVDHDRIHQVVANLVSNAVKFSPHGTTIRIETTRRGGDVVLSVRDEGIGIEPEDVPMLFHRFARIAQPGVGERIPGTGLGLYISKSIVDAHQGTIWVESEPGEGSTFFVALPAASGPA